MFTVGMGSWWAVFAVGRGSWWAVFIIRRGSVGADSGPLLLFVGAGSWGGAGPGSLSLMLGVVMGHRLGGWWWALVAIVLCWVEIR